jgi:hypothetical protein
MKKLTALSVLAMIALACHSQPLFGIFAGPQITTAKYTAKSNDQKTDTKYGFHAGAALKVPFDNNLFFAPAIFYSLKGYKVTLVDRVYPPDTTAVDNNTTIHTVELAALLQYDFGKQANHFFLKAGPTLDFQLFGNEKFHKNNNVLVDRDMEFGYTAYGHYSASLLLQLGYEMSNGFLIAGQYSHGLGSISNADNGPHIRHRVYGISLGKYFTRKK